MDPRVEKLAKTLVEYSVEVKPGDWVVIYGEPTARPLIAAVYREVLRAGGHPDLRLSFDELAEIYYKEANEDQLKHISPFHRLPFSEADVLMDIRSTDNSRVLSGVDPAKQQMRGQARKDVHEIYRKRSASGELRWTITDYPCAASAQEADMSLSDYEDFVYRATFSDQDDPIQAWKDLEKDQERLVKWLEGKQRVELHSPSIDIALSIEGRTFINSGGTRNMPSGEIFTSPVEDSVNGWVEFSFPAIRAGREVKGVHMKYVDGVVVEASAQQGDEYLQKMLDMDEGARRLGELGIGTNYGIDRFTKSILFDEKIGGTIHLAVGSGFPMAGGENESTLHWDMICDMRQDSEILVDGDVFYKDGQFQV